jgi:hypothetical protein
VRFHVGNQLHFIDSQGYHAVNLYTGADIWNAGTADALMFYEEDLFLLDGSSNLSRISSADNVSAPVSVITLEPELPNPDSGWYTSAPRFSIAASDRESYAESTYFRIDEADWQAGAAGELPQGRPPPGVLQRRQPGPQRSHQHEAVQGGLRRPPGPHQHRSSRRR